MGRLGYLWLPLPSMFIEVFLHMNSLSWCGPALSPCTTGR
jgi:hypothetical protein